MSLRMHIEIDDKLVRRMARRGPAAVERARGDALARVCERIVDQAKLNLIKNRSRFTGTLSASLGFKVDRRSGIATVGALRNAKATGSSASAKDYGFFVEHGRGPGRVPSPALLKLWVKRKLGVSGDRAIARATFFVLKKIRQRGIKKAPFLEPAVDAVRPKAAMIFEKELQRHLRRFR